MISALFRFWKLLDRSDRRRLIVALFFVFVSSFLEMIGVGLLPILVATLSNSEFVVKKIASYTNWHGLDGLDAAQVVLRFALAVGIFFLIKNLFSMWTIYRQGLLKAHMRGKFGCELMHGYLHAPYTWHLTHSSGDIQRNMQQEINHLSIRIITPAFVLISEGLVMVLVIGLLLWVAPLTTLMAVSLIFGATLLYTQYFRGRLQKFGQAQSEKSTGLFRCVQESLGGIKELKVLGRTDYFERQYVDLAGGVARADEFQSTIATNVKPMLELVAVTSLSLILVTLVAIRYEMQTILPSLTLFAIAAIRLMPSANRIFVSQTIMSYGQPGFIRLMDDIEEVRHFKPVGIEDDASSVTWSFTREIELSHISYRYPLASKESLTNINVAIKKGESVGFVGESGAGKTTLVDLVLGLLKPDSGSILVDGKDIQLFLPTWQRHLGYIPQHIYLSEDCVRMNVAFGVTPGQIQDDRVWAALEAAQLADLVRSWPEQLDRLIGERGVRLSGGQRQRIGIARAFYHDPAILVLDEATAALDNETEREIVSVLEKFRGEKTLLTIAHRLTTVRHCDKLFYLSDGQVVASGTYEQLEKECPGFKRMVLATASKGNSPAE